MKRPYLLFLCILLCALLAGCSPSGNSPVSTSAQGYDVIDAQGYHLHMDEKPQRIVTLSMETDEIVLGLVRPSRMAAVNALLDDPGESTVVPQAQQISRKLSDPTIEVLVSLQPDLVIVPDWGDLSKVGTLRDLGMNVLVCKGSRSIDEVRQTVLLISQAIGEPEKGKDMVNLMDAELADIQEKAAAIPADRRKKVVLISLMNTYGGSGSMFDDMCSRAGVINGMAAAGIRDGQAMSKEMLVAINPDFLFLPSYTNHGTYDSQRYVNEYLNDPALQSLKAIQQGQLVKPRESYIYNGSQDAVFGIREIAYAVYGDAFKQPDGCHISVVDP